MTLLAERQLKAAIFDFDHTLVELGRWVDWARAVDKLLALYREAGVQVDKVGDQFGFSLVTKLDAELSSIDRALAEEVRGAVYRALAEEEARGAREAELMPGVPLVLDELACLELRLAIVSSNDPKAIRLSLERFALEGRFCALVGRTPALPLKPDPAMFRRCLDCLSLPPGQVVAVGDSPGDIEPAARLGMLTVGVTTGSAAADRLRLAGAAFVIDGLDQLPVLLTQPGSSSGGKMLD